MRIMWGEPTVYLIKKGLSSMLKTTNVAMEARTPRGRSTDGGGRLSPEARCMFFGKLVLNHSLKNKKTVSVSTTRLFFEPRP